MNINKTESRRSGAAHARSARGVPLGREAERLLAALGQEGAYAFPDPSLPGGLILRGGGAGVSVGGGRYAAEAGTALLSAGLAEHSDGRRRRLVIAAAGRARLQRGRWPAETACLGQHLDLVAAPGDGEAKPLKDASESPLAWMARRRGGDGQPLIDAASFAAGERLRLDLTRAAMLPRVGTEWGRPRVDGGGADPAAGSEARLAAKIRVDHALAAVGSDLSGLLIDLCGFLKGLERIESERRWPPRSGKVVARIALKRLAEHYGLETEAIGPDHARPRLWRAAP